MSGTSLDGVDIARVSLVRKENWSFQIHETLSLPYPKNILDKLKRAITMGSEDLSLFNIEYTQYLSLLINDFIKKNAIHDLLAICSHGHTVHHRPEEGYTFQIGNLPALARLTGHRVICDFRLADLSLGGQGAPLVPIGDQLLFAEYDYCLNLGGFANVSYEQNGHRVAFDICAVNVVLNHYAQKLGMEYDAGGAFAKAGTFNHTVLEKLNALEYYTLDAPKSLGIEWVNKQVFPLLKKIENPSNALATYTEHAAQQISSIIPKGSKVLCTGGGSFNEFLMERVEKNSQINPDIPNAQLIEFKEALIFAFLGVLRLRNEVNCLSSVTGASHDHSSGKIFTP